MLSLGRDDDPVFPSRGHGWRLTRIVPLPLLHPVRNVLVVPAACRCERSEDRTDEPEDGAPGGRASRLGGRVRGIGSTVAIDLRRARISPGIGLALGPRLRPRPRG